MKTYRLPLLSVLAFVLALGFVSDTAAQAPSWSHKAVLTFARPFEIPGRILPAGTYVFRLIVPAAHIGQVLNADETEVFGIFFTSTITRGPGLPLRADVGLMPREKGSRKWDRVTGWFSAGETVGDEISYDKYKPVEP